MNWHALAAATQFLLHLAPPSRNTAPALPKSKLESAERRTSRKVIGPRRNRDGSHSNPSLRD
jgi:hypothetical protein